jgi:glycosyltransferase involved in cell wall biosynthesis
MPIYEKLNGVISLASNSPGAPTGYGTQAKYLVDRFVRHNLKTAVLSNYGLEGAVGEIITPYGKATHYPKGWVPHSPDVLQLWHDQHRAKWPELPHALMTLYDVWVYQNAPFEGEMFCWVPIDHVTLPPMVRDFLQKPNVYPVTMAPHGKEVLDARGIPNTYIPHAVDTSLFKPTKRIEGVEPRKFLGIDDDTFLVTMVANNKGNGYFHRKGLAENLMAFSIFLKQNPKSHLYLHMDHRPMLGGTDVPSLLASLGLTEENVSLADPDQLMVGYPQMTLAGIYTASDVFLACSYGEGFNVPLIEAQACGTPVITSNWTAPKDLAGPTSLLVEGQPWWNIKQQAYFNIPIIGSIVLALQQMRDQWEGPTVDEASIEFAKDFAVEKVWFDYWMPFLKEYFAGLQ